MQFNERLAALRRAKGISQEVLAEQLDVSRQAVSKWETGIAKPELDNILALCRILEVSPNELLGDPTYSDSDPGADSTAVPSEVPDTANRIDWKYLLRNIAIWLACIGLLIVLGLSLQNSKNKGSAPKIERCRVYETRALDHAREFTLQIVYDYLPKNQPNHIMLLLSSYSQNIYENEHIVTIKGNVGYVTFLLPYNATCTIQHQSSAKKMVYMQDVLKITKCTKEDYNQVFLIE